MHADIPNVDTEWSEDPQLIAMQLELQIDHQYEQAGEVQVSKLNNLDTPQKSCDDHVKVIPPRDEYLSSEHQHPAFRRRQNF